ncbi:hypothetical protein NQ317_016800 [Molorchus minor]|uniref:K Homology domain-containing protein n=1 Tax=Molorchus minor TaxID=1323400 RepID=A0ABQ9J2P0_9CUCU|nr:hypothetical protein NQ317_016800 [Molorchus minor]
MLFIQDGFTPGVFSGYFEMKAPRVLQKLLGVYKSINVINVLKIIPNIEALKKWRNIPLEAKIPSPGLFPWDFSQFGNIPFDPSLIFFIYFYDFINTYIFSTENVPEAIPALRNGDANDREEGDSGIDANSQGSCSSADLKSKEKRKEKKKKKSNNSSKLNDSHNRNKPGSSKMNDNPDASDKNDKSQDGKNKLGSSVRKGLVFEATKSPAERDDFEATGNEVYVSSKKSKKEFDEPTAHSSKNSTSPKQSNKREEGWKEVVRKSSVQTVSASESGVKKVSVPSNAISRVIGRGGSNINAIRGATGAHIEVEKQSKGQGERIITIKGSSEATKQAHSLIATLIKDPDVDILTMLPKTNKTMSSSTTLWDKTQIGTKKNAGKIVLVTQAVSSSSNIHQKVTQTVAPSVTQAGRFSTTSSIKLRGTVPLITARSNVVRLPISHATSTAPSRSTTTTKIITSSVNQTFAAKLTETSSNQVIVNAGHGMTSKSRTLGPPQSVAGPVSPQALPHSTANTQSSPNRNIRPTTAASAPP